MATMVVIDKKGQLRYQYHDTSIREAPSKGEILARWGGSVMNGNVSHA